MKQIKVFIKNVEDEVNEWLMNNSDVKILQMSVDDDGCITIFYETDKEVGMTITMHIKKFLEEVWKNAFWEGMETVLYEDGHYLTRQRGSKGTDEDKIVHTISLNKEHWKGAYFVTENEEGNLIKDESMKEYFIRDESRAIRGREGDTIKIPPQWRR